MKGHYRFLQTKGGRCYFAQVWVTVQLGGETIEAVDALPERVDPDQGEVNRRTAPTWVTAALSGIRATLAHARQTGVLTRGCLVTLEKLVGSVIDTGEDAVQCAAGLAVWDTLGSPACAPKAQFDGHSWNLVFPACIESPAQGTSP
jgi:hypothetical protein